MNTLTKKIQSEYKKASSGGGAIIHACNCGRLLIKAKRVCNRGDWSKWLAANWPASVRLANDYMRLSLAIEQGKVDDWKSLSIDQALRSLRSRTRKAASGLDQESTPPTKTLTKQEAFSNFVHMITQDAGPVANFVHRLVDESRDGLPIKTEWQEAKEVIGNVLSSPSWCGGIGRSIIEATRDRMVFRAENIMSGDSGLGERPSWKGKGLRVTVIVEVVDN